MPEPGVREAWRWKAGVWVELPVSRSSLKAAWASLVAMRQMRQNAPGAPEGTAGSSMVGGQALRFLAGASGAMGEGGR